MSKVYRPDIDGLRAVAILGVLFFHAFPSAISGGFIGVDIFFVISGYLITSLILNDLSLGRFSFGNFYYRRVRRLFPALLAVMVCCLAFGWFDLFVDEFHSLARHISSGAAFISNFVLARESVGTNGYFDISSDQKPLLHLWSLAVEEQFYLTWPIVLVFAFRMKRNIFRVALALAILSFAFNLYASPRFPIASFYLPFTRMWELLAGILVAVSSGHPFWQRLNSARARNILTTVGFLLLGIGFWAIDKTVPYPSFYALFPVVGTVMILRAGPLAWLNRYVLSHPVAVMIGLISYPLYLWHWPLLAFARIESPEFFTQWRWPALMISFALATVTYLFLERPIRDAKVRVQNWAVISLVAGMVTIGIVAKIAYVRQVEGPLSFKQSSIADVKTMIRNQPVAGKERLQWDVVTDNSGVSSLALPENAGSPNAIAYGDSKAEHIFNGLLRTESSKTWSFFSKKACLPLTPFPRKGSSEEEEDPACTEDNRVAIQYIRDDPRIQLVLVAFSGRILVATQRAYERDFPGSDGFQVILKSMQDTINTFQQSGKKVVMLLDNPLIFDPHRCVNRLLSREKFECGISLADHMTQFKRYYEFMSDLKKRLPDVAFYDPSTILCPDDFCSMVLDHKFIYFDRDHYSDLGAALVANDMLAHVNELR